MMSDASCDLRAGSNGDFSAPGRGSTLQSLNEKKRRERNG